MSSGRASIAVGLGLALAGTLGAAGAYAGTTTPGTPFNGFGNNDDGTLFTHLGGGLFSHDYARDVITLPSGKLVAVGETQVGSEDADFGLAAYEPTSGALDESGFSGDGKQRTDFKGGADAAYAAAPAGANRFVVAGIAETAEGSNRFRFAVARYKASGALDRSFGGDGLVTTRMGANSSNDNARGVVVRKGLVTVAGTTEEAGGETRFAAARYREDGSLDPEFGGDGKVLFGFPGSEGNSAADGISAAGGRKVVVAGRAFQPATLDQDFAVARLRGDGTLDPGFDDDGRATTDIGGDSVSNAAHDVEVEDDRGVVAGGVSANATNDFAVARYSADGTDGGSESMSFAAGENEVVSALALQRGNGRLLAGGWSDDRFALFRLTLDTGAVDTSFSPDAPAGIVYTDFNGASDTAEGMTLTAPPSADKRGGGPSTNPGDPILAGFTDNDNLGFDFALARYTGG